MVLWMAGIEAVDAWDEYKREKNRNKSNHGSGVKKYGMNKKKTRIKKNNKTQSHSITWQWHPLSVS